MCVGVLDLAEGSDILHVYFVEVSFSGLLLVWGEEGILCGLCPSKLYC